MPKKITLLCLMLILTVLPLRPASANEPPPAEAITGQLVERLDMREINRYITLVNNELGTNLPGLDGKTLKEIIQHGFNFDLKKTFGNLLRLFLKEIVANTHLLGKLLFLAVLCALLQNLQSSFESGTVGILAYGVCFLFLTVLALHAFNQALQAGRGAIDSMVSFMEALLPLVLTLLAGVGAFTTAALFQPLMLLVISAVSVFVKDLIFPLIFLTAVLEIIGQISERYRVSNLVGLLKQGSVFTLGLALCVFLGVVVVQGVTGAVSDGVSLRAAKFVTGTFIPVVGKMFADAVELVVGVSLMLKNIIGVVGVVLLFLLAAYPAVKILSLVFIFKITGALIQPMGDERMAKCLEGMGNSLLMVFGAVATVALMFFLAVTIVIGAGSVAVMLR